MTARSPPGPGTNSSWPPPRPWLDIAAVALRHAEDPGHDPADERSEHEGVRKRLLADNEDDVRATLALRGALSRHGR